MRKDDLSSLLFSSSFSSDNVYRHMDDGPIVIPTLVKLSSIGNPKRGWGMSVFYMPHGLTVDSRGRFWVTDVAMHQVQYGSTTPTIFSLKVFQLGHRCSDLTRKEIKLPH